MVSVQAVCNTVLCKAFDENIPVTPMKLQKIIYFIYRDYLQRTGNQLFCDNFQTWKYGPVVVSVQDEFKSFGSDKITRFAKDAQGKVKIIKNTATEIIQSIDIIWALCKNMNGIELSKITHEPNTAWYLAWTNRKDILSVEDIKNDRIDIRINK